MFATVTVKIWVCFRYFDIAINANRYNYQIISRKLRYVREEEIILRHFYFLKIWSWQNKEYMSNNLMLSTSYDAVDPSKTQKQKSKAT